MYTIKRAIPFLYSSYIRPYCPRKEEDLDKLNGVNVRSKRKLDSVVPWRVSHRDPENYESSLIKSLNEHVKADDRVVIVGGGWGVTTVHAARCVGKDGFVYTFEASEKYAKYTSETARLNDVSEQVTVENAIVSHTISTRGKSEADKIIQPEELPAGDVLQLDCEGAELNILSNIRFQPRIIIVETHGHLGAPTEEIIKLLEDNSYNIVSKRPAEDGRNQEKCIQKDVYVVTAVRAKE